MNIIEKALNYYDSTVKKIKSSTYIIIKESQEIVINEKKYKYNDIGTYVNKNKSWTWSWAIPANKLNEIELCVKLLNYGLILDPLNDDNIYLKSELLTSTIEISSLLSLDKYISLSCYLTKKKKIFIASNYYSSFGKTNNKQQYNEDYTLTLLILFDVN